MAGKVWHKSPAADPGVLDQVASWPVPAVAVAVVSPGGVLASYGPVDRPFTWASVTKLLTALTAMDAVARGLLDLDEPGAPRGAGVDGATPAGPCLRFESPGRTGPQPTGPTPGLPQPGNRAGRRDGRG